MVLSSLLFGAYDKRAVEHDKICNATTRVGEPAPVPTQMVGTTRHSTFGVFSCFCGHIFNNERVAKWPLKMMCMLSWRGGRLRKL